MKTQRVTLAIFLVALQAMALAQNFEQIPFTKYEFSQQSCSGFLHRSGSQIYIPENALVHKDGSTCEHKITLKYREMHTPSDIIISKLSMDYVEGDNTRHLETAGMFDIYADCELGRLQIDKNKKIQVRFASKKDLNDIKAFIYDHKNEVWKATGTPIQDFSIKNTEPNTELWGAPAPPPFEQFGNWDGEWIGDDWNDWDDVSQNAYNNYLKKRTEIFKSMNIEEFGLYNYDRLLKEENRIPIIASFSLTNTEGEINKVYVAYKNINSVSYYTEYDWKSNFYLLPDTEYTLFAISSSGDVAILKDMHKPTNLKSKENQPFEFKLTLKAKSIEGKSGLIAATGIE